MGSMECCRTKCNSSMCSFHSSDFGYICYDCLTELHKLSDLRIIKKKKDIKKFMNTPKEVVDSNFKEKKIININEVFTSVH